MDLRARLVIARCGAAAVEITTSPESLPTARTSPTSPRRNVTVPATGEEISTVALSVITSARVDSALTMSPTLTCQAISSASATPSPTSGSFTG